MRRIRRVIFFIIVLFMPGILAMSHTARAAEEGTQDLAKQSQNP